LLNEELKTYLSEVHVLRAESIDLYFTY